MAKVSSRMQFNGKYLGHNRDHAISRCGVRMEVRGGEVSSGMQIGKYLGQNFDDIVAERVHVGVVKRDTLLCEAVSDDHFGKQLLNKCVELIQFVETHGTILSITTE